MDYSLIQHFEADLKSDSLKILNSASNYFLASGDFCLLLITFANSLDQDHDQHLTQIRLTECRS